MPKYVVFRVPDIAFEGIDYLYNLVELKPNDLKMAVISAKNMELARKKYFDNWYELFESDDILYTVQQELITIYESYVEKDLIEMFGEKDGNIIWNMLPEDDDSDVSPTLAMKTAEKLSKETFYRLCYNAYKNDIAVSAIEYEE